MRFFILTISLLTITLFLGGCWHVPSQPPAAPPTSGGSNTATSTTEIDTSDWLMYTNEEYGFEFRYPPNWIIFQEFLTADRKSGDMYQIIMRDEQLRSLNIFVTTRDFVPNEGEGAPSFVIGLKPLTFDATIGAQLRTRSINFYEEISRSGNNVIFFTLNKYVTQSLGVTAVFQNVENRFTYFVSGIFLEEVDDSKVATATQKYLTGDASNQKFYEEFIQIMKTVVF